MSINTLMEETDNELQDVNDNEKKKKKKEDENKGNESPEPIDRTAELVELASIFQQYRKLNSEKEGLTMRQIYPTLKALGLKRDLDEMHILAYEKYGKNVKDTFRHYEFAQLLLDELLPFNDKQENLEDAFKVFDEEESGFIPTTTLRHRMTSVGDKLGDDEANLLAMESDIDRDGTVNYDMFIKKMWKNILGEENIL